MAEIFRKIDTCFSNPARPVIPGSLNLHRANAIAERFRPSALSSCGLVQERVLYEFQKQQKPTVGTSEPSKKMTQEELERRKHQRRRNIRNGSYLIEKGGRTKDKNRHRNT